MAFTAQDVKNLREQTGCGMMDCKKALTESNGDFDKAVEYLREKGLAAAQKKAGRIAAEGMVYATVCGKVGVVVEVNAETDFVAKNDMFQTFVKDVANVVAEQNPADVDALLACKMGEDTVEAALKEKILVIGENIKIRRFERFEGICSAYIHAGGTHAVLVGFETSEEIAAKPEFEAYGKDIAMQIAAANPGYLCEADVPAEVIEKEKEILLAQIANDPKNANKPDAIKEKMVLGRIGKFYKENCLVDQEFVKDNELTVAKYTDKVAKELGGEIKITKFARYEKGEGLEKKADDFAAEVASMMK
ncbi:MULTISPECIES: translation elongation factor Ts [Allofournierella]|uniref:Elongation factor Ts n=1 Tax=Allofournierella massiliensis TaxID=1650663 RepID=A0ABT7UMJ9_9FIRM|nr:translation elongation factor Ts [Fournierella massiliensis]MDM8200121.1 translation elongation factor Ts [Fournierella massiliensis]OUN15469.1 translation elongation factor Ts [Gemmiger sp. An87]